MYSLGTIFIFISWLFMCSLKILFSSILGAEYSALFDYSRDLEYIANKGAKMHDPYDEFPDVDFEE
jgi:hypothetical protein